MKYKYVNSNGEILIPFKIRKRYGIKLDTHIVFSEENDGIKIIPITPEIIERNIGFLRKDKHLLKALIKEKKAERNL